MSPKATHVFVLMLLLLFLNLFVFFTNLLLSIVSLLSLNVFVDYIDRIILVRFKSIPPCEYLGSQLICFDHVFNENDFPMNRISAIYASG